MVRSVPAVTWAADYLKSRAAVEIGSWIEVHPGIPGFQVLDMLVMRTDTFFRSGAAIVLIPQTTPGAGIRIVIMTTVAIHYGFDSTIEVQ